MKKIGGAKGKAFATVKGKAFKQAAAKKSMSGGKAPAMRGLTGNAQPIGSAYSMKPTKAG